MAVVRLRREVGGASSVGLLGTGYRFPERSNVTGSADFRITAGRRVAVTGQLTGTWARKHFYDPDLNASPLRTGGGFGYYLQARRAGRHLNLTLTGQGRSPDYVSETGFTPQVNINNWSFSTQWDAEPRPESTLISWSVVNAAAFLSTGRAG